MTVDKEKLGRLAILATKSLWTTDDLNEVMSAESDQLNGGYIIADCQGPDRWRNANFIAAANPATILSLLAENETLRRDAERYRWLRDSSESIHQFYLSTPIWFTGVKFSKDNVDSTIDSAMIAEAQP